MSWSGGAVMHGRVPVCSAAAHLTVLEATGLSSILRPSVNLCLWRRRLDPDLLTWASRQATAATFEAERVLSRVRPDPSALVIALPASPQRVMLGADIAELSVRFAGLAGCGRVRATLSLSARDVCRKFHVDHVGLRLFCTYAGPGTEWIPNDAVRRDLLSRYDLAIDVANRSIQGNEGAARGAKPGEVLLLKGEGWPGNGGNGAVHRAPPIAAARLRRLVLTLDAVP
ncbi:DUF1826 domain-containing protein [Chondromyces crocatus]|uniref:DUF1826 domain-containing protein n=1 Tax=Chondromyces crocatus TaxID=52 RepID=A0A0K1EEX8_CHOCO|nr:DUF1826 domain-containing protein [Chondromyces crocatus]AKT39430.1 uncharacterized protein CMC5_035770 [Chondromyces crocatus]